MLLILYIPNAMMKRVSIVNIHREGLLAERPDASYTEDGF